MAGHKETRGRAVAAAIAASMAAATALGLPSSPHAESLTAAQTAERARQIPLGQTHAPLGVSPPAAAAPSTTTPPTLATNAFETASISTPVDPCAGRIGVSRTVVLDTQGGPHFGRVNGYQPAAFLRPKEVVLTFDDGPNPRATGQILDILQAHCAKATFFVVGNMARWHPALLKRIAAEGHTIAGHTLTHPIPFSTLSQADGEAEIERGFAAVTKALGAPIAAFFRFPGLDDGPGFLDYLSRRDITALSVDVIGGDTRRDATAQSVTRNILSGARKRDGGILLLHDPLKRTARALPAILEGLAAEGFSLVHLRTARPYAPPRAPEPGDGFLANARPAAAAAVLSAPATAAAVLPVRAPIRASVVLPARAKPVFEAFAPAAIPAIY